MPRFFNSHAHCFTMNHVPAYFFGRLFPVTRILNRKWIKKLVKKGPVTGRMPFPLKVLLFFLGIINLITIKKVFRLLTMVKYGNTDNQVDVIEAMRQYYPQQTGIVFLTMDMEYMGAGLPKIRYQDQLIELALIKNTIDPNSKEYKYKDIVYPFVFVDPRRIKPVTSAEQKISTTFTGDAFLQTVEQYITSEDFQSLKMYPALGYYPFDIRMKDAYDLALKYDLPIMSHCTVGSVHHKYKVPKDERVHPVTKKVLSEHKPSKYQIYFSHPLNYKCLMDVEILKTIWGETAPNYQNLKICLAHWGSGEDWHRYLEQDWADVYTQAKQSDIHPALDLDNWHTEKNKQHLNFTWFTIIYELLKSEIYPNIYADISYTLYDDSLLPMLKIMLESNQKVREHVLFGTDFYMVSKVVSERAFGINLRAFLGEELFNQIAVVNAKRYLSNNIVTVQ